jgi:hypothetical protein
MRDVSSDLCWSDWVLKGGPQIRSSRSRHIPRTRSRLHYFARRIFCTGEIVPSLYVTCTLANWESPGTAR